MHPLLLLISVLRGRRSVSSLIVLVHSSLQVVLMKLHNCLLCCIVTYIHFCSQLNKSCPLPEDTNKPVQTQNENVEVAPTTAHNNAKFHGRRLRQRQEKNYYENARRSTNNSASNNSSVKSLQLSPHKGSGSGAGVDALQLSALKSSVQSYFRAGQTFRVLARRLSPGAVPAYLIEWDSNAS